MKHLEGSNQNIIQNIYVLNNDINIQPKYNQNMNINYQNEQKQLNRVNSNHKIGNSFIIKNKSGGSLDTK